jgi:hypothetical protein
MTSVGAGGGDRLDGAQDVGLPGAASSAAWWAAWMTGPSMSGSL